MNITYNSTDVSQGMEALIDALINLGGSATTDELVEYFSVENGRQLTGVRSAAQQAALIEIKNRTWTLVDHWQLT